MAQLKLKRGTKVKHRCQCGAHHEAKVLLVSESEEFGRRFVLGLQNGRRVLAYAGRVEAQP